MASEGTTNLPVLAIEQAKENCHRADDKVFTRFAA
jgi:hypothetical protein